MYCKPRPQSPDSEPSLRNRFVNNLRSESSAGAAKVARDMERQHEVGSFQKAVMIFVGLRNINMGKPVGEMCPGLAASGMIRM